MPRCVTDIDYMNFIETRISFLRSLSLHLHALRCLRCSQDIKVWPALRRIVHETEKEG